MTSVARRQSATRSDTPVSRAARVAEGLPRPGTPIAGDLTDRDFVEDLLDTLGSLYLKKGLVDRAISLLEEAHQRAPKMPDAQLHLAQAYRAAGREADAAPLLEGLRKTRMLTPELRAELDATARTP